MYDSIRVGYSTRRRTDPRNQTRIEAELEGCEKVLNVGAGTGCYEPAGKDVTSLEPSAVMMGQRTSMFEGVRGVAEEIPFADRAFDAAMAVHTVHHWSDPVRGLREMKRVVRDWIVIFTWDKSMVSSSWFLCDYFPACKELALTKVRLKEYEEALGGEVRVIPVPIPWDCADGFPEAYWRRPELVVEPGAWRTMSPLCLISEPERSAGLRRLASELKEGLWARKYGHLLTLTEFDMGNRIVVWRRTQRLSG